MAGQSHIRWFRDIRLRDVAAVGGKIEKLSEGTSAAFCPRPVIVRLSDFKTNEYASLIGGEGFEPRERTRPHRRSAHSGEHRGSRARPCGILTLINVCPGTRG
jgi:phosphoenolpyruvate synthase/pyruvate phosphate dikinase